MREGHAVAVVGHEDKIKNKLWKIEAMKALLIGNLWRTRRQEESCGWLPYDCFLKGFAEDV